MSVKIKTGASLKAGVAAKTAARRTKLLSATQTAAAPAGVGNDLVKTLAVVEQPLAKLVPANRRVRRSNVRQVRYIADSIKQHGFVGVILVAGTRIVDGHQRVEALKQLGCETVPTIDVSHLTKGQIDSLSIAVNRIGETGEWDLDNLRLTLAEVASEGLSLEGLGFSLDELDTILLDPLSDGIGELDQVPEDKPGPPTAKLGDLWQLSDNRLLCESALEANSYKELLGGASVALIFTDPPYNVKIKGNVSGLGKVKHDEFAMASGEQTAEEFEAFLATSLKLSAEHLIERGVAMAFMDWRGVATLLKAGDAAGLTLINMAVWDKGNGGMGALYRSTHELVPVFCKGTSPLVNNIKLGAKGRDRCNVWHYPGANQPGSSAAKALASHPTPKNVEMVVDAMLDVTNKGDAVLDPFCGSGTTIIAAEECGRAAYAIDIEPKFIDSTIRRWEALVGLEAVLIATGETFAEVAQRRSSEHTL